jgi:hypothetical protein
MERKKNKYNKSKKYALIVKINSDKFCKWKANNIEKFTQFLNTKYPTWCYINVFDNNTKLQVDSIVNPVKEQKKYTVIVRVDNNKKCCKWRVNDYKEPLFLFLNTSYPDWRWIDVYDTTSRAKVEHIQREKKE